ncbi:hypothetical protein SPBR_01471 [Sporothrix brasiliensis 5110]|uniref:Transmembrane protein n=1 Tax=Sporothrix brasiliensis 5110 TaxID=1398154 RepID=A0A0C2FJM7_9PEZI|nr:uncharacterized protein SPBR_01471 [Sporothrix brasiliensis 5110]KIH91233.1 hypothetical protein SPBR_01471 [Sporothrix brasiliensis 5110]
MRTSRHHQASTLFFFASPLTCSFAVVSASVIQRDVDVAAFASSHRTRDGLPAPLSDTAYLPAQIGGIVGSYAFCLVVVAVALLLLSKRRREHLQSGEEFDDLQPSQAFAFEFHPETLQLQDSVVPFAVKTPGFFNGNDSNSNGGAFDPSGYAASHFDHSVSPTETHGGTVVSSLHAKSNLYLSASYASSFRVPGVDPSVDQEIVTADREMAQSQLEQMYKYVMEQEEAKANGVVLHHPPASLGPQSGSNSTRSSPIVANPGANVGFNNPSPATSLPPQSHYYPIHRKDESTSSTSTLLRKVKSKPANLVLTGDGERPERSERTSRASSILSALKSPRGKKKMQGVSISSPIMTPMSGTFPRFAAPNGAAPGGYGYGNGGGYVEAEEMNPISPRHYAPAAPPPVPTQQPTQQPTPETSPLSTLSIDERIGASMGAGPGSASPNKPMPPRNLSLVTATTSAHAHEPLSAVSPSGGVSAVSGVSSVSNTSVDSSAPLVGLPTSPKPGVNRFPSLASLPASPRATKTTFSGLNQPMSPTGVVFASASPSSSSAVSGLGRSNAPSAVRTGGGLPLRAYEPAITSPSFATHNQTKQTVFERAQPLSPGFGTGSQTPWTGAPVPYTPYQPFSPVIPMTPSLVTKADRKRMRRLEPKTPTMEMVQSTEDIW